LNSIVTTIRFGSVISSVGYAAPSSPSLVSSTFLMSLNVPVSSAAALFATASTSAGFCIWMTCGIGSGMLATAVFSFGASACVNFLFDSM